MLGEACMGGGAVAGCAGGVVGGHGRAFLAKVGRMVFVFLLC